MRPLRIALISSGWKAILARPRLWLHAETGDGFGEAPRGRELYCEPHRELSRDKAPGLARNPLSYPSHIADIYGSCHG